MPSFARSDSSRAHISLDMARSSSCRVAPFGDRKAHLIIIGLAPGFHGANATGRPFTGDYAGVLLYQTLHKFGFANQPESVHRNDGLKLIDARISNAVKCVPPDNKPLPIEITTCNHYLQAELAAAPRNVVLLALGSIGHNAVLRTLGLKARPGSGLRRRKG